MAQPKDELSINSMKVLSVISTRLVLINISGERWSAAICWQFGG